MSRSGNSSAPRYASSGSSRYTPSLVASSGATPSSSASTSGSARTVASAAAHGSHAPARLTRDDLVEPASPALLSDYFKIGTVVNVRRRVDGASPPVFAPWQRARVERPVIVTREDGTPERAYDVLLLGPSARRERFRPWLQEMAPAITPPPAPAGWAPVRGVPVYAYVPAWMQGWGVPPRMVWAPATVVDIDAEGRMRVHIAAGRAAARECADVEHALPLDPAYAAAIRRVGQEMEAL